MRKLKMEKQLYIVVNIETEIISFLFYYPVLSEFCSLGGVGGGLKYANIFESANKTNCGLCVVVVVIRCTSHVERGGGTEKSRLEAALVPFRRP